MTGQIISKSEAEAELEKKLKETVPAAFRADLIMQRQQFRNEDYYVIKDPLALTYFRIKPEEAFLVTLLNGKRTLKRIGEDYYRQFPHLEQPLEEIHHFIRQIGNKGLLNINARRFVDFAQKERKKKKPLAERWVHFIASFIFFKIPLVDPSPWLGKLTRTFRILWSRGCILLAVGFFLLTLFWLSLNREAFSENTIEFFSPRNLLLLWVTIAVIKTLHEFGHAMTCRHFGGEVHEMGLCFIMFTPCGYVDASDAWMMRHKRHKIFTTLAGLYTEFLLASIAAWCWLYLPDGLSRNIAFNAMVVASVNSIFFNLNPLMRFDGYYIISDLLEIPNLRAKAFTFGSLKLQEFFFGIRNIAQEQAVEDDRHGKVFCIYAVCAYIYMFFVIYSIGKIFTRVLEPFGLKPFGDTFGVIVQMTFLLFPFLKATMDAMKPKAHIVKVTSTSRRLRNIGTTLFIVLALLSILPSNFKVKQQGIVLSAEAEQVGVEVPGTVEQIYVKTGDRVEPGQILALLKNPEVEEALVFTEANMELAKLDLINREGSDSWQERSTAPESAAAFEAALAAHEQALQRAAKLQLRSSISGAVLTPDLNRLLGVSIPEHTAILRIGNTSRYKLVIPLTEDQAQLVDIGSAVRGRWQATGESFKSEISVLPQKKMAIDEYLPGMLSVFGGPAPNEGFAPGSSQEPSFALFLAEADLPESAHTAREGMRVQATIEGKPATYAKRIWRSFLRIWNAN